MPGWRRPRRLGRRPPPGAAILPALRCQLAQTDTPDPLLQNVPGVGPVLTRVLRAELAANRGYALIKGALATERGLVLGPVLTTRAGRGRTARAARTRKRGT